MSEPAQTCDNKQCYFEAKLYTSFLFLNGLFLLFQLMGKSRFLNFLKTVLYYQLLDENRSCKTGLADSSAGAPRIVTQFFKLAKSGLFLFMGILFQTQI